MIHDFWYRTSPPPAVLLPLARLYHWGRRMHVAMTDPQPSPVPTLCVGNLVAGGGGKTPVTMALRSLLADLSPWVLLRGYGGQERGPIMVGPTHTADRVGDEALLHANQGPTVVSRHRYAGAEFIHDRGGRLIIMDDGLQNRDVTASINFLVLDGTIGLGNGGLLPAGPLREPLADALDRTDAIIIVGPDQRQLKSKIPSSIPLFAARFEPDASHIDKSQPYLAFCGLARPQKFFDTLKQQGIRTVATRSFPDHHSYTLKDLRLLNEQARSLGARLITTTKDQVKIKSIGRVDITVLPITCVFDRPDDLRTFIKTKMA